MPSRQQLSPITQQHNYSNLLPKSGIVTSWSLSRLSCIKSAVANKTLDAMTTDSFDILEEMYACIAGKHRRSNCYWKSRSGRKFH